MLIQSIEPVFHGGQAATAQLNAFGRMHEHAANPLRKVNHGKVLPKFLALACGRCGYSIHLIKSTRSNTQQISDGTNLLLMKSYATLR
jgi:hypothetical protein